jgi:hypothetical protein
MNPEDQLQPKILLELTCHVNVVKYSYVRMNSSHLGFFIIN